MVQWPAAGYRATSTTEVKRSRFLCTLARTDDEAAARELIADARRTWPDARHHCSAFILSALGENATERSSDDGEPAGTAGTPMLEALRGSRLLNVTAVVTRYFGGVLLGTGGLVRAYADAVTQALVMVPRVSPEVRHTFSLEVTHLEAGRLEAELRALGVGIGAVTYGEVVTIEAEVADPDPFPGLIANLSHGTVVPMPLDTRVVEVPV